MMMTIAFVFALLGSAVFADAANLFTRPTTTAGLVSTVTYDSVPITPGPLVIVRDDPAESISQTTLITTFENGDVVTGRFELQTLTEYIDLHQHLTVTSTTTYNGTDGNTVVAVAAGIVMAGGSTVSISRYSPPPPLIS